MTQTLTQSVFAPKLRVFLELDQSKLSAGVIDRLERGGENPEYVDMDRARDQVVTEEIMAARKGALVIDEDGRQVAKFAGGNGWKKAEAARRTARVVFDIEVDGADPEGE